MLWRSCKINYIKLSTSSSVTTDIWTSRATIGYVTLICHFLTDDWELKSVVLETTLIEESRAAKNIAAILVAITDKYREDVLCNH